LSSCKNTVPAGSENYILWKYNFKGNQKVNEEEFRSIIPFAQKENTKPFGLPITPRVWWYNFGQTHYKKEKQEKKQQVFLKELESLKNSEGISVRKVQKIEKKLDRVQENLDANSGWLWRNIGEKQVVINESQVLETSQKLKKFLFDIGYRDADVGYVIDTLKRSKKLVVTYKIEENIGYKIDSVIYDISDTSIDSLINFSIKQAKVKRGDLYDLRLVEAEKLRIEQLLKNEGYYNFNNKYIVHSATNKEEDEKIFLKSKRGYLKFEILNPDNKESHDKFVFEEVVFKAFDPNVEKAFQKPDTVYYNGVKFIRLDKGIPLGLVRGRILSVPSTTYRMNDVLETQRQIGLFNQFAFVSSQIKTLSQNKLSVEYFAPLLEKYTFGISPGVNNIYNDGSTFFGFGVPVSLTARNNFKKLEIIEASFRASYEGQPSPINVQDKPIRGSLELGVNLNVTLPNIFFLKNNLTNLDLKNPRTILGLGYNYSEPFWGKRLNFKLSTNFSIQVNKNSVLYLSMLDANLINTSYANNSSGQEFYNRLVELQAQGNNLKVTFDPQFVSSFNANYVYNNQNLSKVFSSSKFFRLFVESGGTLLNLLNDKNQIGLVEKLFPLKTSQNSPDSVRAYFRFVKINADYRRNINISQKSSYAYRFNVGVTNPYGANRSLPYDKNFFIGGSNSVRAWAPRTLGTGSSPADTTAAGNTIPQPGDILLESSIEYRKKVFRFAGDIQIAAFLDAGNVWKWYPSLAAEKVNRANFDLKRFYKEIALGTGVGIRWDLSYFLFRFDWGIKVFDPSRAEGDRFVLDEFTLQRKQRYGLNWNFGIGYPF
jgi:outer membrane protein insertion porin family